MTPQERVIFHADMNAYYASVEELLYPQLKQVPMAVCGDPESRRGIILAKNIHAKKCGVQTAETIYQARRKCPNLVLRPARHDLYQEYCEKANDIYDHYTDLVERASIDESYMDVTGSLGMFQMDAEALAHEIRLRIQAELGLTISVGVSYNKFFAKMASDLQKPNAVTLITRENFPHILWPLPIGSMFMVGKVTETTLRDMNIHTIGNLAQTDIQLLTHKLGKLGLHLHRNANGLDDAPVLSPANAQRSQSVGNGLTFKRDLVSREDIQTALSALSDSVAARLRGEGLKCMTVQVTIKDPNFRVITRQKPLPMPTWLASDLSAASMELIDAAWKMGRPIRLLTVTALKLIPKEHVVEQLTLFEPVEDEVRLKKERLAFAMDQIREKYGSGSITVASIIHNDLGIHESHEETPEEPL